jgi:hypothetical protein
MTALDVENMVWYIVPLGMHAHLLGARRRTTLGLVLDLSATQPESELIIATNLNFGLDPGFDLGALTPNMITNLNPARSIPVWTVHRPRPMTMP